MANGNGKKKKKKIILISGGIAGVLILFILIAAKSGGTAIDKSKIGEVKRAHSGASVLDSSQIRNHC